MQLRRFGPVRVTHTPLTQVVPAGHCLSSLPLFAVGLAPATVGAEASIPPRRAAPINLSALPLETSPLASPLARASKERPLVPSVIGAIPFFRGAEEERCQTPTRYVTETSCSSSGAGVSPIWAIFDALFTNFRELPTAEVRGTPSRRSSENNPSTRLGE